MRKRFVFLFLLVVVLAGAVILAVCRREREPEYGGKRLSQWVKLANPPPPATILTLGTRMADGKYSLWLSGVANARPPLVRSSLPPATPSEAEEAIRQIGIKGLPHLLKWIRYEQPAWKPKLLTILNRMFHCALQDERDLQARGAAQSIPLLGSSAEGAILELARLMNDVKATNTAARATSIVSNLRSELLAADIALMTHYDAEVRNDAIRVAGFYFSDRLNAAVPALVQCLHDSNEEVAAGAARVLGSPTLEARVVVPALACSLQDKRLRVRKAAIDGLWHFHAQAQPAVPALLALLKDPDPRISNRAADALEIIDPHALEKVDPQAMKNGSLR